MNEPQELKEANNKGKPAFVVACGIIGLVFVCIGLTVSVAVGIVAFSFSSMKSTAVYENAVAEASVNSEVINALGEPIETGWFLSGSISVANDSGEATLFIPLKGSKADGTLYLEATKSGANWRFHVLEVVVDGRSEAINLLSGTGR